MHDVNLSKADNGYVVSHYGEKGEMKMIAKDMDEAIGMMKDMMSKVHKEKKENFAETKAKAVKMAMKK